MSTLVRQCWSQAYLPCVLFSSDSPRANATLTASARLGGVYNCVCILLASFDESVKQECSKIQLPHLPVRQPPLKPGRFEIPVSIRISFHTYAAGHTLPVGTSNNTRFRLHQRAKRLNVPSNARASSFPDLFFRVCCLFSAVRTDLGRQNASTLASFR
jgi:hypothetical protein